jgi:hypothetical protein
VGRLAFLRRLSTAAQDAILPHFIESTRFINNHTLGNNAIA